MLRKLFVFFFVLQTSIDYPLMIIIIFEDVISSKISGGTVMSRR